MRCFVAVDVPAEIREVLLGVADALRRAAPAADARWASPEQLHLTLAFLGTVQSDDVGAVRDAVAAAVAPHPPPTLRAGGLGCFPGRSRPRVVWVGVADDAAGLASVAADVARALAPLGFPPEERPFRAHVTLARLRTPRGTPALVRALDAVAAGELGTWTAADVTLYRSHLHPRGARYEVLARLPFVGPATPS